MRETGFLSSHPKWLKPPFPSYGDQGKGTQRSELEGTSGLFWSLPLPSPAPPPLTPQIEQRRQARGGGSWCIIIGKMLVTFSLSPVAFSCFSSLASTWLQLNCKSAALAPGREEGRWWRGQGGAGKGEEEDVKEEGRGQRGGWEGRQGWVQVTRLRLD